MVLWEVRSGIRSTPMVQQPPPAVSQRLVTTIGILASVFHTYTMLYTHIFKYTLSTPSSDVLAAQVAHDVRKNTSLRSVIAPLSLSLAAGKRGISHGSNSDIPSLSQLSGSLTTISASFSASLSSICWRSGGTREKPHLWSVRSTPGR